MTHIYAIEPFLLHYDRASNRVSDVAVKLLTSIDNDLPIYHEIKHAIIKAEQYSVDPGLSMITQGGTTHVLTSGTYGTVYIVRTCGEVLA
jgi:hypothetical protein